MFRVSQEAYLKHCCSLFEAVVETIMCSKVCYICSTTNTFAYASIEHCTKSMQTAFLLCLAALCIDSVSFSYAPYILDCPCTSNFELIVPFTRTLPTCLEAWFSYKVGSCFLKVYAASWTHIHFNYSLREQKSNMPDLQATLSMPDPGTHAYMHVRCIKNGFYLVWAQKLTVLYSCLHS